MTLHNHWFIQLSCCFRDWGKKSWELNKIHFKWPKMRSQGNTKRSRNQQMEPGLFSAEDYLSPVSVASSDSDTASMVHVLWGLICCSTLPHFPVPKPLCFIWKVLNCFHHAKYPVSYFFCFSVPMWCFVTHSHSSECLCWWTMQNRHTFRG